MLTFLFMSFFYFINLLSAEMFGAVDKTFLGTSASHIPILRLK